MKKIIGLIAILILAISMPVFAQTEDIEVGEAGTTPDSPLYFLDVAMDNIAMAMQRTDNARMQKQLEVAEERLAEIKVMAEKGNVEGLQKAEQQHEKILARFQNRFNQTDDDLDEDDYEQRLQIENRFQNHGYRVQQVNDFVEVKVKGNLSKGQQELVDSIIDGLEDRTEEVEIQVKFKNNEAKVRLRERGVDVEDIAERARNRHGFGGFDSERMKERAESMWERVEYRADIYNASIPDKTGFDNLITEGDSLLENGEEEAAKDKYEEAKDLAEDLKDELEDLYDSDEDEETEEEETECEADSDCEEGEYCDDGECEELEDEDDEEEEDETEENETEEE